MSLSPVSFHISILTNFIMHLPNLRYITEVKFMRSKLQYFSYICNVNWNMPLFRPNSAIKDLQHKFSLHILIHQSILDLRAEFQAHRTCNNYVLTCIQYSDFDRKCPFFGPNQPLWNSKLNFSSIFLCTNVFRTYLPNSKHIPPLKV